MTEEVEQLVIAEPPRLTNRQIAAVAAGNALEFYDFVVYAIFAVQIGRAFFPSDRPGVSLLASLATFGVGFLTRPLGAFFIGRMGDRQGRKPAMLLSLALIGVSVAGLALTPGYATLGVAAPALAIFFRLLQGFALGGEVGPSTALLLESAPEHRRGLYVSFQAMSADAAVLVAGGVGVLLSGLLAPASLDAWGWRLALLAGIAVVPFSLLLRRTLLETVAMEEALPPSHGPRKTGRVVALGLCMLAAATVANYVLIYLGTYASTTLGIVQRSAFASTMLVGLGGVLCDPLSGWLSDRFGRRPVMIAPAAVLLLLVLPAFWLIVRHPVPGVLYAVSTVLACVLDLSTGTILVAVSEALPRTRRSGGFALVYALAISTFGGSTQFVVAWLTRITGAPLAPAVYMLVALCVGIWAMSRFPETAPRALADGRGPLAFLFDRVNRRARAEVAELMSTNPVARRNRYPAGHRALRFLFAGGTFARFVLLYLLFDLAVATAEAARPLLPATPFALPAFDRETILYLSSYILGAQVGLLGVISLALALVTLVAQREDATTDVKVYYHESMFLGIAASGVALSAVVGAQFLWPLQAVLHLVGGGTPSLVYRSVLVSAEIAWLVVNLAAVAHFVAVTFAFVQRDARERLRERYTANVVVPGDLLDRVRQHFYAAAAGSTDGRAPGAFFGFGAGVGDADELRDRFARRTAVVDLRLGLVRWVLARWSARCFAAPPPTAPPMSVGPKLWFTPRLDQPLDGSIVWCRRSGGVPLTPFERWVLRRAFVFRAVRDG